MNLEFNPEKGYGDAVIQGRDRYHEQYLTVPVIRWLHENVGPLQTQSPQEVTHGDGWELFVDWDYSDWHSARTYVIINKPISTSLITKFWMKFQ